MLRPGGDRIGGWLVVLVVLVGVLTPLAQAGTVVAIQRAAPRLEPFFGDAWPAYRALMLAIIGLRVAICLYVAWRLTNDRRRETPRVAIVGIWVSYVVLGAAGLAVAAVLGPVPTGFAATVSRLFWQVVISAFATAYLLRSKRVAATYARAPGRGLAG